MEIFSSSKLKIIFSERVDEPMNLVGHPDFDINRKMNRSRFLQKFLLWSADAVFPLPIHGTTVLPVSKSNEKLEYGNLKCDGLITDKKGLVLTMTAADCPTVFLWDKKAEAIGILHSGWRSLTSGILEAGIKEMKEEYNTDPKDLEAWIGPGICADCFNIGPEVAVKFQIDTTKDGPYFVSLGSNIMNRLLALGIPYQSIHHPSSYGTSQCTKCTKEENGEKKYYSWRGDKSDPLATNMAAIVML